MKSIKVIILLTFALACSSENNKKDVNIEAFNNLKRFDYEPLHQIRTKSEDYHYQILVNDVPVFSKFQNYITSACFNINSAILHKGKQKLTIIVYPKTDLTGASSKLSNSKDFKLTLFKTAWFKDGGGLEDEVNIIEYTLPEKNSSGETINYSELGIYSQTMDFEVDVPYEMTGWANSQNLNKNDSILKEQVFEYYKNMKSYFEHKDPTSFYNNLYGAEELVYQSLYLTKEKAIKQRRSWIGYIGRGNKMEPIENYELFIFGDGKLVGLKRTDDANYGEGVLRVSYTSDLKQERTIYFDILLHKPKGKEKLEAIWFNMADKNQK